MSRRRSARGALSTVKAEEYYNALATNIRLSGVDLKVIALSSVRKDEGKTTTSRNVALAFARAGYRTLLIDMDLRNAAMTGLSERRSRIVGLTDFLSGQSGFEQVISGTDYPNLEVIESGQTAPNPTGLLQSDYVARMLEELRKFYDYIIIDTPPIGTVIDAAIIAQQCDGVALVIEAGANRRREVQRALKQLEQTEATFLGVVLNKFKANADEYGSYGDYGQIAESRHS